MAAFFCLNNLYEICIASGRSAGPGWLRYQTCARDCGCFGPRWPTACSHQSGQSHLSKQGRQEMAVLTICISNERSNKPPWSERPLLLQWSTCSWLSSWKWLRASNSSCRRMLDDCLACACWMAASWSSSKPWPHPVYGALRLRAICSALLKK